MRTMPLRYMLEEPSLEVAGQAGRPRRAVALADEELRRGPALVTGREQADEIAHGRDVLDVAVELGRVLAGDGPAIAGRHGVDEAEVGDVEERELVVDEPAGRAGDGVAVFGQHDLARAEGAHMQPDRRRARAAVVNEGDGALDLVLDVVAEIGGEVDVGAGAAVIGLEEERPGHGRIGERLAIDRDDVGRHRDIFFRELGIFLGRRSRLRRLERARGHAAPGAAGRWPFRPGETARRTAGRTRRIDRSNAGRCHGLPPREDLGRMIHRNGSENEAGADAENEPVRIIGHLEAGERGRSGRRRRVADEHIEGEVADLFAVPQIENSGPS